MLKVYKKLLCLFRLYIIKKMKKKINNQLWSPFFHSLVKKELSIIVGFGSYGYTNFPKGTVIGNYCSFADGVKYLNGNHPVAHVSTAAVFYNPSLGFVDKSFDIERTTLTIGNDVWIGENVLITNKCTKIGNGVVIGAGSIITRNIPPYTIVVGNPGKILKQRFSEETVHLLEQSRWWDLGINEVTQFLEFIDKPLLFAQKIIEYRSMQ